MENSATEKTLDPTIDLNAQQRTKLMVKVNGDSKACFEKLLFIAKKTVIILAKSWNDPLFELSSSSLTTFMKNNVPIQIILGDSIHTGSPTYIKPYLSSRSEKKLKVYKANYGLCSSFFRWCDLECPEFPVIADSNLSHIRFCDTSDSKKPVWYSVTNFDDVKTVDSVRQRLNIILNHPSTLLY